MPAPIAVQLYTLREEAARDCPAVLERLGRIGYLGVEPAGLHELAPEEFARRVEEAGMVVASVHAALPRGSDANEILDVQQAIGSPAVVVPLFPPDRFRDAGSVRGVADELNEANQSVRARGMHLGYHNHWWEFASHVDGRSAHALLFELLDPTIFAEVDVYWARVGGADPAEVVAELGGRARLLHVKDGPADEPGSPMTAVGEGVLDLPAVLAASDSVYWHIVELDRCATDMFEAVERSYRYLVGCGLSRGRA